MITDLEKGRKAQKKGDILKVLAEDYNAEMTSVRSLALALDTMGLPPERAELEQHLVYLGQQGYLQVWRGRDLPQFRPDRAGGMNPSALLFLRLTPKGLQLVNGVTDADPMVNF